MSRANKAGDTNKTEIYHRISKVLVNKARSEHKLWQLQNVGNEKWNEIKAEVEKSWVELRNSFLDTSQGSKKEKSNSEK